MKPGDIVHLNWTPQSGTEIAKPHYGLVLSCQAFNQYTPRVAVAPITSKYRKEFGGLRIKIAPKEIKIKGYICLDHIRMIDPIARKLTVTQYQIDHNCLADCKFALKKIFSL